MKKISIIAILSLFLLIAPNADSQWYFDSEYVIANIKISAEPEIIPLASDYYADYVIVNMTFFPQEFNNQEIIYFQTSPEAELDGNSLKYRWSRPEDKKLAFSMSADVKAYNKIPQIKEKIKFPLELLPDEVIEYTKPSKTIDSGNEEIIRLASELARGDDDLYSVAFKMADWTKNNINYNLSTLTAKASQNASWVLQNRQGVCDELTSLFIAMLRSLGVPAKFISGVAYTNSPLFDEGWGSHGWAEVYFPKYGWIPYDVTYGQFGYIDPSHFKFKESIDPDEGSTFYLWQGRSINLFTKKLEIATRLIRHGEPITPLISLKSKVPKDSVGFGSYALVEAEIKNPNDYYLATELFLSKPDEVEIMGPKSHNLMLLPNEGKKAYWILKVDSGLNGGLVYTMPLLVSTGSNLTSYAEFIASAKNILYSYDDISNLMIKEEEEKEKSYSAEMLFRCSIPKNQFYIYENQTIECSIRNSGNVYLEKLGVCYLDECYAENIGISQDKKFNFNVKNKKTGFNEASINAENALVSKSEYVKFEVLDEPGIEIEKVDIPDSVAYEQDFPFVFNLKKASYSAPENIVVKFRQNGIEKEFSINKLAQNKEIEFNMQGRKLKPGANKFKITAEYHDRNGRIYQSEADFSTALVNLDFTQKAKSFLYQLGLKIAYINIKTLVLLFVTAALAFLVTLWYTFKPTKKEKQGVVEEIREIENIIKGK